MAHHPIPEFNNEKYKRKPYLIKAVAFFQANSVTDSTKKRALLVASLSTQTIQILAGTIAPRTPNLLTYEVVTVPNERYDPNRHEITEN